MPPKKYQTNTYIDSKSELRKLNETLTSQIAEIKSGEDELSTCRSVEFFSCKVDEQTT